MTPDFRDVVVPLPDGTALAGRLLLPEGDGPFPVLLSLYPYRKDDFIGSSNAYSAAYFAQAGYASLLVDLRGHGGSGGRAYQAWDPREHLDGEEVVAWAAAQDWSTGNVGMWGASYGGATSFGVAARRPPALKAIASVYGAADIYHDFVYPGGCPNALGASAWGALMLALELAPPSLQDPGGRWLEAWRERLTRLDDGDFSHLVWPAHPGYDEYWRERAVPIEKITVPSLFVSGWRDLLCQAMLHAYARCTAPKRLLVGPWTHTAPDMAAEAPYDYLRELRYWWDRWLIDPDEPDDRPGVVYYVQGAGEWRSADRWPPGPEDTVLHLGPGSGLTAGEPAEEVRDEYAATALVGTEAGLWYPMGVAFAASVLNQAADDARSLAYTTGELPQDLDLCGAPRARLRVARRAGEQVNLAVKLCAVAPDGASVLITSGWHRIAPSEDAGAAEVEVELYPTAYRIPLGHRLRLTVACADFPRIWPTAQTPVITVLSDAAHPSGLRLPLHAPGADGSAPRAVPLPEPGVNRAPQVVRAAPVYRITRDVARDGFSVTAGMSVELALAQGGTFALEHEVTASMENARPAAASVRTRAALVLRLAGGEEFTVHTGGQAAAGRRHLSGRVAAGGETVYERRWTTINGRPVGSS
ncbi:CocE/NonD family hydrolase [Rhizohabitans arisaemae]|uniref:CocE/NonD family hydrolase n=1 Tax=Rhizohabitans arisaemae TaxID=2720610 RepID=UPI0024B23CD7|nr:CocE/NonD family hydrolase [Rhizohabitans arisaemae]